ncbi:Uncharacterised protein [Chryseobacterium gleum]|uniref:Uncharacterized protein n=2 Tax=Chryseobacterium gleum TaxID=250 RepID=A0A3S4N6H2_CHRGE|nr:hypothetical protein [Chryseobacterium gleum]EFK36811.1 hypothetical protein HMPREF0204_11368 [Chryseobacterium gleum ATCC 35910]QQY32065.1 hypothetical protein I6I60_25090 [Chryseobacterium gleum]VEE10714.1 Uncharacterised protein [Chryseobacterium gleum]
MKLEFETATLGVDFEKLLSTGIEMSKIGEELSSSLKNLDMPIAEIKDKFTITAVTGIDPSWAKLTPYQEKKWDFPEWHFEVPPKVYTLKIDWD